MTSPARVDQVGSQAPDLRPTLGVQRSSFRLGACAGTALLRPWKTPGSDTTRWPSCCPRPFPCPPPLRPPGPLKSTPTRVPQQPSPFSWAPAPPLAGVAGDFPRKKLGRSLPCPPWPSAWLTSHCFPVTGPLPVSPFHFVASGDTRPLQASCLRPTFPARRAPASWPNSPSCPHRALLL